MKIAIFGSAFNPPSLGHKSVLDRLAHFDLVLLVPSIAHAWGKEMINYKSRCEMIELFIQDCALHNLQLCTIEQRLITSKSSESQSSVTTHSVLTALQAEYKDSELTFVVGPDNFLNFSKFYKADEVVEHWSVLACPETLPIRSTTIRQCLSQGKSIDDLTTVSVARYLEQHHLYR